MANRIKYSLIALLSGVVLSLCTEVFAVEYESYGTTVNRLDPNELLCRDASQRGVPCITRTFTSHDSLPTLATETVVFKCPADYPWGILYQNLSNERGGHLSAHVWWGHDIKDQSSFSVTFTNWRYPSKIIFQWSCAKDKYGYRKGPSLL